MIRKLNGSGNTKQAVRAYRLLMGFPMEDTFTVALQTATKNFQRKKGLKADGIAGPLTLAALVETLPDVLYKDYSGSEYVRAADVPRIRTEIAEYRRFMRKIARIVALCVKASRQRRS